MKLKLNRYAQERSFRTANDFALYADKEQAKFADPDHPAGVAETEWAKTLKQNWGAAASAARTDPARLPSQLESSPVFPFRSALTRTLLDMQKQGRASATAEIIPFLTGARDAGNGRTMMIGQMTAHAEFTTAVALANREQAKGGFGSFDDLIADFETRLETMLRSDAEEIEGQRTAFSEMLETAKTHHERLDAFAKKAIRVGREQWDATHDAFLVQLTTETAVKLWRRRAALHHVKHESYRRWAIGFGGVGILTLLVWIFGGFALARLIFAGDTAAQLASYTAGSIALFTLYVWGLRVLIRSMMSEDHLQTDASARSALAHTYLALIKEEAATPEDRAIVLVSLFAPVSDGLVKDDGMPALSPMAMAANILTNPRPN